MRNLISAASMAALLAATSLAGTIPAVAAGNFDKQDQYISSFCAKYRGADQCNHWRAEHTNWTSDQYRDFYRRHQKDTEFATPEAAGLFGVGLGAAATGASEDGDENND